MSKYVTDGRSEDEYNFSKMPFTMWCWSAENYLFFGSHEGAKGAKGAAIIYLHVGAVKQHEIDSFKYLKDILS